jgi:GH3 auxin-responsive promoter
MPIAAAAVNALWGATSSPAWLGFRRALRNPAAVQERILLACVRRNAGTLFGRAHGFESIRSIREYQQRVPPASYDDIAPLVYRAARGEEHMLTRTPIERLVPSSGSTAAAKFIPFTRELRGEFTAAIDAWLVDLFTHDPALLGGPSYWSISPAIVVKPGIAGSITPTGFDSDSRYLGGARGAFARSILAVPDAMARVTDVTAFQYLSALFLLHARDLRLVSVWHPSFFGHLLDRIACDRDRLVYDIEHGSVSVAPLLGPGLAAVLLPLFRPNRRRADELRRSSTNPIDMWPNLSLISCWGDGPSTGAALALAKRCDGIAVQPKGLVATEGIVTIPFEQRHPIAIRSHFFEFVESDGNVRLAHELQRDTDYRVLLTTGGGLYRYQLGDRVRVDDFVYATPSLRFVGKDDRVSDLFGEKLSDGFVAGVLERLFRDSRPQFAMLAPSQSGTKFAYTLFVSSDVIATPDLATRLERELRHNPHYGWCVDLGQLTPARIIRVRPGATNAFMRACTASGQRLGDVKPASLALASDWADRLPALEAEAVS